MADTVRVLVVDDSPLMRRFITNMLQQDPTIQVVGEAADGREAIMRVGELRPDVVTMDVRMPVMDGLLTTEHLMAYCPTPILVLTAQARQDVDLTFRMLGAGALEVMEKPEGGDPRTLERVTGEIIRRVKMLARVRVVTHLRGLRRRSPEQERGRQGDKETRRQGDKEIGPADLQSAPERTSVQRTARPPTVERFPVIVIGASTGGPRVVYQILSGLPAGLAAAVVVVQHIAEGFSAGMAEWLADATPLPVRIAAEGDTLRPREALLAPDQRDLIFMPNGTVHMIAQPLLLQRPSIDVAMQAAAEVYGRRTIGVLLTGMGRDGARGLQAIRRRGGFTIAQDEASCVIPGMPRAAIQLGAAAEVLPPARIAERLGELVLAQAVYRSGT
jgi:two-component system chemotaxis response regulator CheB